MGNRQYLLASFLLVGFILTIAVFMMPGERLDVDARITSPFKVDQSKIVWDEHEDELVRYSTRSLGELMTDQRRDSVFYKLANASLNRKGLPNFYIHGLKSDGINDYRIGHIVFLHVHKSGGSTMKGKLRRLHTSIGIPNLDVSAGGNQRTFDRIIRDGMEEGQAIFWGGFSFGVCDVLPGRRPCSSLTMIRDPYDRIISAYFFCFKQTLCGPVYSRNVTITAWAIHQGSHVFNQLLMLPDTCKPDPEADEYRRVYMERTKHIIEYTNLTDNMDVCWFRQKAVLKETLSTEQRRALLNHMLDNLERWFAVIGVTEDFELSLEMAQQVYRLPLATETRKHANAGRFKPEKADLERIKRELMNSPEAREALYEDRMIYQRVRQIMQRQKEEFFRLKAFSERKGLKMITRN